MPEYLAPGVYVEEVDTGSKPIEGVSTSTSGMVGITERGPVNETTLVTGFADYRRQFGGFLSRRVFTGANWLFPHAVDGFFTNGGKRLYVVRVLPDAATYAIMQLFGAVGAGFSSTLASSSRPGERFLIVDDPTNLAAGDWLLVDDGLRTEYLEASDADVLALRASLATAAPEGDAVTPYTFAPTGGGLSTNPTNLVAAGDDQIVLNQVAGLNPGGGDILRIGAGNTVDYVVTATANPADATVPVTLAAPVAFEHPTTDAVRQVDPTHAPGTQLAAAAGQGAWLIDVDDQTLLAGADAVAFGPGTPAAFVTLGDLGIVGLPTDLRFRHAGGVSVVTPTLTDIGADRATLADAAAGDEEIEIAKRDDLAVGMLLLLTGANGSEYVVIDSIDPTAGAGPDNPGKVTLTNALQLAYATGATAHPFQDAATDSDETQLARAADAGDDVLLLVDRTNHTPTDIVRIDAAGSARVEYFELVATTAALVSVDTDPVATHPAGTALTEHAPMAQVQALDRGAWGNSLQVTAVAEDRPTVATTVTTGGPAGNPSIVLRTGVGVEPGTLLEFLDAGGNVTFRQKAESVSGRTVSFGAAGLEQTVANDTNVRSAEFALEIAYYRLNPKTQKEEVDTSISEAFRNLTLDPRHSRYFQRVIGVIPATVDDRNEGESSLIRVRDDLAAAAAQAAERPAPDLLTRTTPDGQVVPVGLRLTGGDDQLGALADSDLVGTDAVDPADRTGLQALKNVEEISIVAVPGRTSATVQNAVLAHCELMRYRFGVLDSVRGSDPNGATLDQVQTQRSLYDSKYGALYYPWVVIDDPFPQNPAIAEPVKIPPSGHMIGIYARSDVERGVHKAPANEVVRGVNDLQVKVVKEQHDILNPRNVNVLRDFRDQGRGLRVWGARAVSSDPDWRYLSVRRLFNFIEASIDRGTQWVVFEPNDYRLWARVSQSVSAFLTAVWRDGALMGRKPEQAFYVKCDETTMSQYDIDNGRLIMVIGIAPVKPAEFVVIRIGQWAGGSMVEEA
jgi:Bacteriophage tail sheath protein